MEDFFEGLVPVCVHPLFNPIENQHGKGIFWMFLIKASFTQILCLIRKPKPERQSVRKPDSSSSAASGAAFLSLALFNGCADLRAGFAVGVRASWHPRSWSAWRSLPHLQHAALWGSAVSWALRHWPRWKGGPGVNAEDGASLAAGHEERAPSCRLISFFRSTPIKYISLKGIVPFA